MKDLNTYKLLTPGPLTTTPTVKETMLIDRCTWDSDYNAITQEIRHELLRLAHVDNGQYTAVLMQGSGTFGVESVLTSIPAKDDTVLVLVNGAYSKRMCSILEHAGIKYETLEYAWDEIPDTKSVDDYLNDHPHISMVSMVHSETTSGLLNDIESIGKIVKKYGKIFIVDAMSSFGAVDIDMGKIGIDFLISSANKCIQGVPGFSFIIGRLEVLLASKGNARSLSLDLYDQYYTMEHHGGKWRFTSPTHVVAAFRQALRELETEGGQPARLARYKKCNKLLREGMEKLGFKAYIKDELQGPIITTYLYPENFKVDFSAMHEFLKQNGYVIYPGKLTDIDTFRLGNIGEIYEEDIEKILSLFKAYKEQADA